MIIFGLPCGTTIQYVPHMPQRNNKTWNTKLTIAMAQFNVKKKHFYCMRYLEHKLTSQTLYTNNDGTEVLNTTLCAVYS